MKTEYRLDELFDLQMGKTPSRNNPEYWGSKDFKWISIADLSQCGKYIYDTKEYLSKKGVNESGINLIPENTIVMSFKLSIGKTALTPEPMYSNEAIMSFRDKHVAKLIPDYLYYLFSGRNWEAGTNNAVMGKTLNKATLSGTRIKVHDFETQREIVGVLDKLKSAIDSRVDELNKFDELIKARFVEMFGEDEYPLTTIADLVEKRITTTKKDFSQDDLIRYIDISSIDNNRNRITGCNEYILSKAPSRAQQHIVKNDILISTVRPNLRNVAITTYDDENLVASSGFCVLRAIKCLPSYLMAIACSDEFTDAMSRVVTGANYPAIKDSDVMSYRIPLPPIEIQKEFERFTEQVDKSKVTSASGDILLM